MPFFFRLSVSGGALAVITFPVSVSLSQSGLFLAVLGWILWSLFPAHSIRSEGNGKEENYWKIPFILPFPMIAVLGLYFTHLISSFYHFFLRNAPLEKSLAAEPADVFLTGMAFWTMGFISDPRGRKMLYRWLGIAAGITVFAGLIGLFSRIRLSRLPQYIASGFSDEGIRLQHHLGSLFIGGEAVHFYMPVGLMNTHLTYAAHLAMFIPFYFLRFLDSYVSRNGLLPQKKTILYAVMPLLLSVLLIANNGRSAQIGLSFALSVSLYFFIKTYWNHNRKKLLLAGASAVAAVTLIGGSIAGAEYLFPDRLHLLDRIKSPFSGKSKSTDYQRQFLWQATSDIIKERPLTGTGPGFFEDAVDEKILKYSKEKPQLWFGYEIIQRGHAHNDYLHQWAVSGAAAFILYVSFIVMLFYQSLGRSGDRITDYWKWGALFIIAAGFFQCYFTDDETLLPFWIFAALIMQNENREKKAGSDEL